ncbi:MAG: hypothetical protein FJ317_09485 [SAR202 cluster bacterium]|nr:hypothetical protein [SAR202 cluster bacterium]
MNLAKTGVDSAIISYVDDNQAVNLSAAQWTATWLIGSGDLLDAGERVEIQISLSGGALGTALGTSTRFKVEVKPTRGATLVFERTTPAELKTVNDLG